MAIVYQFLKVMGGYDFPGSYVLGVMHESPTMIFIPEIRALMSSMFFEIYCFAVFWNGRRSSILTGWIPDHIEIKRQGPKFFHHHPH